MARFQHVGAKGHPVLDRIGEAARNARPAHTCTTPAVAAGVVHNTACSEESAAVAAELARGGAYQGRSRYETPWTKIRTIADCRHRLEESRRIRLASLGMWPDAAHLDNEYQAGTGGPMVNAIGRFVPGLMHEESHLKQVREIVRQAQDAREG